MLDGKTTEQTTDATTNEHLRKEYKVVNGTSYDAHTDASLIEVLERVREKRTRVVLTYGSVDTGRVWESATPERGSIGRSMGPCKIPLLIRTRRSYGGEGILDHCILRVQESVGGRIMWEHKVLKEKCEVWDLLYNGGETPEVVFAGTRKACIAHIDINGKGRKNEFSIVREPIVAHVREEGDVFPVEAFK